MSPETTRVTLLGTGLMGAGNFTPGGACINHLKDLDNVQKVATELTLTLPITTDLQRRYRRLVDEMDGANLDHSAIYLEVADRSPQTSGDPG